MRLYSTFLIALALLVVSTSAGKCRGPTSWQCKGDCVNLFVDPFNCGQCGRRCNTDTLPHTTSTECRLGACRIYQCMPGFGDCNGYAYDGCEKPFLTSLDACGRCGNSCPSARHAAVTCNNGQCTSTCSLGWDKMPGDTWHCDKWTVPAPRPVPPPPMPNCSVVPLSHPESAQCLSATEMVTIWGVRSECWGEVAIASGTAANLLSGNVAQVQPTRFVSGVSDNLFAVQSPAGTLTWTLKRDDEPARTAIVVKNCAGFEQETQAIVIVIVNNTVVDAVTHEVIVFDNIDVHVDNDDDKDKPSGGVITACVISSLLGLVLLLWLISVCCGYPCFSLFGCCGGGTKPKSYVANVTYNNAPHSRNDAL